MIFNVYSVPQQTGTPDARPGNRKIIARDVAWNWADAVCDAAIALVVAPFLVAGCDL